MRSQHPSRTSFACQFRGALYLSITHHHLLILLACMDVDFLPGTELSGGLETTGSRARQRDKSQDVCACACALNSCNGRRQRYNVSPEGGRWVSGGLSQGSGSWLGLEGQLRITLPECCRWGEGRKPGTTCVAGTWASRGTKRARDGPLSYMHMCLRLHGSRPRLPPLLAGVCLEEGLFRARYSALWVYWRSKIGFFFSNAILAAVSFSH